MLISHYMNELALRARAKSPLHFFKVGSLVHLGR